MSVLITKNDTSSASTATDWYTVIKHALVPYGAALTQQALSNKSYEMTFASADTVRGLMIWVAHQTANISRDIIVNLDERKTVGSFTTATERVNITGHGLADLDIVSFSTAGVLPTGITANTLYYVRNSTANDFQLSLTDTGSIVLLSGTPSGTSYCWVQRGQKTFTPAGICGTLGTGIYATRGAYVVASDFNSTVAVNNTSTYRLFFRVGAGTGTWYYMPCINAADITYALYNNTPVARTNGDTLIWKNYFDVNSSFMCNDVGVAGSTVYSTAAIVCSNPNATSFDDMAFLRWLSPASSYTATFNGTLRGDSNGGIQIGTEASPIPIAQQAIITWGTGTVGSAKPRIELGNPDNTVYCFGGTFMVRMFGEKATTPFVRLDGDHAVGATTLTTKTASGWAIGDVLFVGKQSIKGQGSILTHTITNISGTTIDITPALATAVRKNNAPVALASTNSRGVLCQSSNTTLCTLNIPQAYLHLEGVVIFNVTISRYGSTYYMNEAQYPFNLVVNDCLCVSNTNNVTSMLALIPPTLGAEIRNNICVRTGPITSIATYYGATFSSGRTNIADNIALSLYTAQFSASSSSRYDFVRNEFYNGLGATNVSTTLSGINCRIDDNVFYGFANSSAVNTSAGAVGIRQFIAPISIARNKFDNNTVAIGLQAYVSSSCLDIGSEFGQEEPNTTDIYFCDSGLHDYTFKDNKGDLVINTTRLIDCVEGQRVGFVNFNQVPNDDRTYFRTGLIRRSGYGLADTTVWNGSAFAVATAGQFSMKMIPTTSEELFLKQSKATGDITGKIMSVSCRLKILSSAFYAGVHVLPKLSVTYDGNTTAMTQATATTEGQLLVLNFTPATAEGSIRIDLSCASDAIGADSEVLFGELVAGLPEGVSVDTTRFSIWSSALPLPPVSTIPVPSSVWSDTASYGNGTKGALLASVATSAQVERVLEQRLTLGLGKVSQGGRTIMVFQNGQPDGTLVGQTIIIPSTSDEVSEGMFAVYPFQFATVVSNTTSEIEVDRDLRNVALLPVVFDGIIVPGLLASQIRQEMDTNSTKLLNIEAKTNNIQDGDTVATSSEVSAGGSAPTATEVANKVWQTDFSSYTYPYYFGTLLRGIPSQINEVLSGVGGDYLYAGTITSFTESGCVLSNADPLFPDDHFKGCVLIIPANQNNYQNGFPNSQFAVITGYVGATKTVTLDRQWASLPEGYLRAFVLVPVPSNGATAEEVRIEMDNNSTKLLSIKYKTDDIQKGYPAVWEDSGPSITWVNENVLHTESTSTPQPYEVNGLLATVSAIAGPPQNTTITRYDGKLLSYDPVSKNFTFDFSIPQVDYIYGISVYHRSTIGITKDVNKMFTDGTPIGGTMSRDEALLLATEGGGATPEEIWAAPERTLTQSAVQVAAIVAGQDITVYRGDAWTIALTGLGSLAGRTKLWFTVKTDDSKQDNESTFQLTESEGLVYLKGVEIGDTNPDRAWGDITVTDEATGALTITIKGDATSTVDDQDYVYDIQILALDWDTLTKTRGVLTIRPDVTRGIA